MSSLTASESSTIRQLFDKYGLESTLSAIGLEAQCVKDKLLESQLNSILKIVLCVEWFSLNLFSFLSLQDISTFDLAFTNHLIRILWLKCPKLQLNKENRKFSNDRQLFWLSNKNIFYVHFEIITVFFGKYDITDNGLISLAKQCKYLQSFSISRADEITEKGLSILCQNSPLLKHFCLISSDEKLNTHVFPKFHLFHHLNQYCPLLETLDLYGFDFADEEEDINTLFTGKNDGLKLLKSIKIREFINLSDDSLLIQIGLNCHLLEEIMVLTSIKFISHQGVITVLHNCPLLKIIYMNCQFHSSTSSSSSSSSSSSPPDELFSNISHYCPLLQEVCLLGYSQLNDIGLAELGKLTFLEVLNIPHLCCNITTEGIHRLVNNGLHSNYQSSNSNRSSKSNNNIHILSSSSSSLLNTIVLGINVSEFPSTTLYAIADSCPQLKCLKLYVPFPMDTSNQNHHNHNDDDMNESFKYLMGKCTHLTELSLGSYFLPREIQLQLLKRGCC